jgi:hypothetical protein
MSSLAGKVPKSQIQPLHGSVLRKKHPLRCYGCPWIGKMPLIAPSLNAYFTYPQLRGDILQVSKI